MNVKISAIRWRHGARQTGWFLLRRLHLLLVPLLLVLTVEALHRNSFIETYHWLTGHPDEFALNCWVAFFLTLLAVGLTGRTRLAYGLLLACGAAAGFISGMTMNRTGLPLVPWSLLLPHDGADPVDPLNPLISRNLTLFACAAAAVWLGSLLLKNLRLRWQERLVYSGMALFLLASVYLNGPIPFWDEFRITTFHYEQEASYNRNGFLISTLDNLRFAIPVRPADAGSKEISKLVRTLNLQRQSNDNASAGAGTDGIPLPPVAGGASDQAPTKERPNVIVLLSESFWDPTLLPKISFSEDPIPYFHSLMDSTTSGWMLSPQFSGTTANVEFEVLSGNSVRFLPDDSIAYISYMNRGVDSLASIFSRQGYTSTAINPFFNWFFNSRNVYRNFGFSRFISCEFFEPKFHGPNYEDAQVMEKIIETTASTPGADFVFANTMENHGSYEDKFYSNPIKVTGPVSDKVRNMLENYATGEQAFDKAFRTLVEHYAASGEPTVILCFGDHLPGLGYDYLSYREGGLISGRKDPDLMEKTQYTPFVIWDNMNLQAKQSLRMNASFLGPYLLKYANRPGSYYTDFLYQLYEKQPVIPIRSFRKQHPVDERLLADYKRLQYDILFGSQQGYKESGINGQIVAGSYTMGYGSPKLAQVAMSKNKKLTITGGRFSDDSTVWLNGVKMSTSYEGPNELTVRFDDSSEGPPLPWTVEVKLFDRKQTLISRSEPVVIEAPALTAE